MASESLLHKKSIVVITGASRGIGKEIAIQFSSNIGPNSTFILLSRNVSDLQATANEIQKINPTSICHVLQCDISKITDHSGLQDFEKKFRSTLSDEGPFDMVFMIHNAGTTGDVSKPVKNFENGAEIREHLETNVVSYILLTNVFLRVLESTTIKRVFINITSLVAIKSLTGYGLYPVGKAAREAFSRSLVVEDKHLRVLNYSPGPVKTEMFQNVVLTTCDESTRQKWTDAPDYSSILTPEQTVTKLIRVLEENTFEDGSHVDYYDIP